MMLWTSTLAWKLGRIGFDMAPGIPLIGGKYPAMIEVAAIVEIVKTPSDASCAGPGF